MFRYKNDAKKLVEWLSINITKFRPAGAEGNNFKSRKQSHEPFGSYGGSSTMRSMGGFGEKKFSGFTT